MLKPMHSLYEMISEAFDKGLQFRKENNRNIEIYEPTVWCLFCGKFMNLVDISKLYLLTQFIYFINH